MYKIKFLDRTIKEFDSLIGADLRGADLCGDRLYGADLRGSCLIGANLRGAYLYGADLRGANLEGANLYVANLGEANLEGAGLKRVNLRGANLYGTNIIGFQLGKHFGFYHEGYVKIGCKGMSLEKWLRDYESIGEDNGYTAIETLSYGDVLKMLKKVELRREINDIKTSANKG